MRVIAMIVTMLLAGATVDAEAQSSATESGPQGPRTGQDQGTSSEQDEIRRLREQLDGLTRKLEGLSKESVPVGADSLAGTWSGAVSCRNRHYAVVLTINEQTGSIGKGDWSYTGSGSGTDIATLSPMASEGNRYVLVTAKSNTYDYDVTIDGDRMDGMSTRDKCQIFMERAKR
ncbi:hypothetical protein LXM94_05125 [Rhizobium sp. TRM95111]|uniref:hypothetical protein n=1 Tax=Rhizobium alarense TaxID=2846851 RepID=UPI001F240341|nr:hypothetical protein [Rhizobium alarense]MCF3639345.1 hypothetical protein [Rhizobium alarense]